MRVTSKMERISEDSSMTPDVPGEKEIGVIFDVKDSICRTVPLQSNPHYW
jgi:hypothetical protein